MANSFSVRIEGIEKLQRRLDQLGKQAPRAVALALNDTAKHVRTLADRDIRNTWAVQKKTVMEAITIRRATRENLEATVTARSKPIGLIKFSAKQYRVNRKVAGVSYRLKKGKRQRLSGAFIATMSNMHVGVFFPNPPARPATKGKYYGKRITRGPRKGQPVLRNPIIERRSITIPSQWGQVVDQHIRAAQPFLLRRLEAQVDRLLKT